MVICKYGLIIRVFCSAPGRAVRGGGVGKLKGGRGATVTFGVDWRQAWELIRDVFKTRLEPSRCFCFVNVSCSVRYDFDFLFAEALGRTDNTKK